MPDVRFRNSARYAGEPLLLMTRQIVTAGDSSLPLTITHSGDVYKVVTEDGASFEIAIRSVEPNIADLTVNGRRVVVPYLRKGATVEFVHDGETYRVEVTSGGRKRERSHAGTTSAPMPGVIRKIEIAVGDAVDRGTPLLVLEAMKMEHQIAAPHAGKVMEIRCSIGELVQPGVDLVEIEPQESA